MESPHHPSDTQFPRVGDSEPPPTHPRRSNLFPLAALGTLAAIGVAIWLAGGRISWENGFLLVDFTPSASCINVGERVCLQPLPEVERLYRDASVCDGTTGLVCLVPMGSVTAELIAEVESRLESQFSIQVGVLPPMEIGPEAIHVERNQLDAENLAVQVNQLYGQTAGRSGNLLLAITPLDIYLPSVARWHWAFGQLSSFRNGAKVSLISTHRMATGEFVTLPGPLPIAIAYGDGSKKVPDRAYKMVLKYVGIGHFGLAASDDPDSVLYNKIRSVADLDRMGEDPFADE